jgi:hypothetical protein
MAECLPERALWSAVVIQAFKDARISVPVGDSERIRNLQRTKDDAFRFLTSRDRRPGSFFWICDCLGIGLDSVGEFLAKIAI